MLVFWQPKLFAFIFAGIVGLLGIGALLRGLISKPSDPGNGPHKGYQNNTEDGSYQEVDD